MAGDTTIQEAIQTLLRALGRYGQEDVTLADFRVLGNGSGPWAIILPGPFRSDRPGDWGQIRTVWTHYVECWRVFAGDSLADHSADRQDVLDTIAVYPTLNGTTGITLSTAVSSADPIYLWRPGQDTSTKPALAGFRVTVETEEDRVYSTGEFT